MTDIPSDEMPGTPENLAALKRLLDGWHCCGAPSLCNAACQETELNDVLARAHAVVSREVDRMRQASHD